MLKKLPICRLAFLILMSLTQLVLAHGGVSMEDDVCIIDVGEYRAHFTGYQPKLRATQEFCEDIPEVASSIFVIDFIDNALRGMPVSFRILKDVNEIGNDAKLSDLGGAAKIEEATIHYSNPSKYPAGTVNFSYNFSQPGRYIGIFSAHPKDRAEPIVSVFPFSVGVKNYTRYYLSIILVILLSIVGYWIATKVNFQAEKADVHKAS